jgi:predicted metal-dependent peptidase
MTAAIRPADGYALLEQEASRQRLTSDAAQHIAASRSRLILGRDAKSVFFAVLALRLRMVPDWHCETMATDGHSLNYNPAFVCGLTPDERLGVLVHEVMHNALAHPLRRGSRALVQWNIACDLAVNPLLLEAGFTLPQGHLLPGQGNYTHLAPGGSAEEYYAQLEQPSSTDKTAEPSNDPGGCGSVRDPSPQQQATPSTTEGEWAAAVLQAQQAASVRGELPAGLARLVEAVVHPPSDWRSLLREFLSSHARNDYSWQRPNRRFLPHGLYLPSLHSEELGTVVVAVDTSGSVGERELAIFAAELQGILEAFACHLTILYHDTHVQKEQHWHSSDGPLRLEPVGGGGTSHECVFAWLATIDTNPSCVVCLTDLETCFPNEPPTCPVLWAVIGKNQTQPPFGQRVCIG